MKRFFLLLFFFVFFPMVLASTIVSNSSDIDLIWDGNQLISSDGVVFKPYFVLANSPVMFPDLPAPARNALDFSVQINRLPNGIKWGVTFTAPNNFPISEAGLRIVAPSEALDENKGGFRLGNTIHDFNDLLQLPLDVNFFREDSNRFSVGVKGFQGGQQVVLDPLIYDASPSQQLGINRIFQVSDKNFVSVSAQTGNKANVYFGGVDGNQWNKNVNVFVVTGNNLDRIHSSIFDANILAVTWNTTQTEQKIRFCFLKNVDCTILANWQSALTVSGLTMPVERPPILDFNSTGTLFISGKGTTEDNRVQIYYINPPLYDSIVDDSNAFISTVGNSFWKMVVDSKDNIHLIDDKYYQKRNRNGVWDANFEWVDSNGTNSSIELAVGRDGNAVVFYSIPTDGNVGYREIPRGCTSNSCIAPWVAVSRSGEGKNDGVNSFSIGNIVIDGDLNILVSYRYSENINSDDKTRLKVFNDKNNSGSVDMNLSELLSREPYIAELVDYDFNVSTVFMRPTNPPTLIDFNTWFIAGVVATRLPLTDVRITSPLDGNSFSNDGNQLVRFDLNSIDSVADDFVFDVNFSTVANQGTGTVIVNDANLALSGNCDTNNTIFPSLASCGVVWQLCSVTPRDYNILIFAEDDLNRSDFNRVGVVSVTGSAPTITSQTPPGAITQSSTSFVFSVSVSDGSCSFDAGSRCDSNAVLNGVPISGEQNVQSTPVNGVCTRTLNLPNVSSGDRIDMNWHAVDAVGTFSSRSQSFTITYEAASGSVENPLGGGGGGGGGAGGGLGSFCTATTDCLVGLVCDVSNNRCVASLPAISELKDVFVSPREISSDPFQDVLPNSSFVLPDIVLTNNSSKSFDMRASFECSDEKFCAKDWCVFSQNSSKQLDFSLGPRGIKSVSALCTVSGSAKVGEFYQFQIVFRDKVSNAAKAVSVAVPIRFGTTASLVGFASSLKGSLFSFFDYGLLCFDPSKGDCLVSAPSTAKPLEFNGLVFRAFTVGHLLVVVSVFLVFYRYWLVIVPILLGSAYAWALVA